MPSIFSRRILPSLISTLAAALCSVQPTYCADATLVAAVPPHIQPILAIANPSAYELRYPVSPPPGAHSEIPRPKRESETWMIVVIALGLIAFQLRRTQRLVQHRPLSR